MSSRSLARTSSSSEVTRRCTASRRVWSAWRDTPSPLARSSSRRSRSSISARRPSARTARRRSRSKRSNIGAAGAELREGAAGAELRELSRSEPRSSLRGNSSGSCPSGRLSSPLLNSRPHRADATSATPNSIAAGTAMSRWPCASVKVAAIAKHHLRHDQPPGCEDSACPCPSPRRVAAPWLRGASAESCWTSERVNSSGARCKSRRA